MRIKNKKLLIVLPLFSGSFAVSSAGLNLTTDFNADIYGVAAISAIYEEDSSGINIENESRIGFRVNKDMSEDINVFMQIESGYVGEDGSGATLGARDTFIGLKGNWGKVRFGRMLTPLYELVDWPYSNPGLGRVFDWGGDVAGHYDRKGDIARYDSPLFAGMSFSLSGGRGDVETKGSEHFGSALHYQMFESFVLHAAYEHNSKFKYSYQESVNGEKTNTQIFADTDAYLAGFEWTLPKGFGLAAAYKYTDGVSKTINGQLATQEQVSIVGQYWNGPWGMRLGYATNLNSDANGAKQDDSDYVVSGQLMYIMNGFLPYLRIGQHTAYNADSAHRFVRVGMEYSF